MTQQNEQRRHERFIYNNAVTLILDDGRRFQGMADNLGYGGAAMLLSEEPPPEIPEGSTGKLKVIFFGRPTEYPCTVVSVHGAKLGIKIQRTDYQGAPEAVLSLKN
ncbi:MAG: PilZ domain-containing protein [Magnetococcales bacterium]|nr:PilZ domain-containing protein [Magnetococcales bacterium]